MVERALHSAPNTQDQLSPGCLWPETFSEPLPVIPRPVRPSDLAETLLLTEPPGHPCSCLGIVTG